MAEERRETERAVAEWRQRVEHFGFPPLRPSDAEFDDLIAEGGAHRFIISVDQAADDHVLLTYGAGFAELLGLRHRPGSNIRLLHEIPPSILPAFVKGCREAGLQAPPVKVEGEVRLEGGRRQLYRAVFMPIGVNLVFGAFNSRIAAAGPARARRARRARLAETRDPRSEEAAIAAFIRLKGITRCPTAYALPTRGSITAADQAALERHAAERERAQRSRPANLSFWALET
jgi:hypothetical protein